MEALIDSETERVIAAGRAVVKDWREKIEEDFNSTFQEAFWSEEEPE